MVSKNHSKSFPTVFLIISGCVAFAACIYLIGKYIADSQSLKQNPDYYECPGSSASFYLKKTNDVEILEVKYDSQQAFHQLGVVENGVLTFNYSTPEELQ